MLSTVAAAASDQESWLTGDVPVQTHYAALSMTAAAASGQAAVSQAL